MMPLPGGLRIYRAARADAQKLMPHGDEPAEWVAGLHRSCCGWAEARAARWCQLDQRLRARWLALQSAVEKAELELARARGEEEGQEAERLARVRLRPEEQNPLGDSLPTWAYLLLMALLTCLELPLVFLSFTAFGLSPVATALLSLLCSVLTAFLGHALGSVSRHRRVRSGTMLGVIVALCVGFTISLAWLREGALEVVNSRTATLDPRAAALALFAISLASLAMASLLAWHHGVDPLDRELHRARLLRRRWERQHGRLQRRLRAAESQRLAARETARQEVLAFGQAMLSRFHRYARWNQHHRDSHDLPAALREEHLPTLPMPAVLQQPLTWQAGQDLQA